LSYDSSLIRAVAALETRNGAATIKGPNGEDSHNLFNIKDFSGKGYRAKDLAEGSNDAYRVYASRAESEAGFIDLLRRKYPDAHTALATGDGAAFAKGLKKGGYATDPAYESKLMSVIARVRGEKADTPAAVADDSPEALTALAGKPKDRSAAAAVAALAANQAGMASLRASQNPEEARDFEASRDKEATEAEGVSFGDAFSTGLLDPRVMNYDLLDVVTGASDLGAADPTWRWADQRFARTKGMSDEERGYMDEWGVQGQQYADRAAAQVALMREQNKVYGQAGPLASFAGMMAAGSLDIPSWAMGLGIGKVASMLRTGYVAAKGVSAVGKTFAEYQAATAAVAVSKVGPGAALGVSAGEQIGGQLLVEAMADVSGRSSTAEDYMMATAFAVLPFAVTARGTYRSAADRAIQTHSDAMADRIPDRPVGEPPELTAQKQVDSIRNDFDQPVVREDAVMTRDMQDMIRDTEDGVFKALPVDEPAVKPTLPTEEIAPVAKVIEIPEPTKPPVVETPEPTKPEVFDFPEIEDPGMVRSEDRAAALADDLTAKHQAGNYADSGARIQNLLTDDKFLYQELSKETQGRVDRLMAEASQVRNDSGPRDLSQRHFWGTADGDPVRLAWTLQDFRDSSDTLRDGGSKATKAQAGYSLREFLQGYADSQHRADTGQRALAKYLLEKRSDDPGLDSVRVNVHRAMKHGFSGHDGVIRTPFAFTGAGGPLPKTLGETIAKMNEWAYRTGIHEAMHSLTQTQIAQAKNHPTTVSPSVRAAVTTLTRIVERLRLDFPDWSNVSHGVSYAARNEDELLAMFFDNPAVQRHLSKMPASPEFGGRLSSAFAEVVDSIKRLLGIVTDKPTARDETAWAIDVLLDRRGGGAVTSDGHSLAGWPGRGVSPHDLAVAMFKADSLNNPFSSARTAQTETPEFKTWFGDSKVADENRRPLVVYHGTKKSFSAFKDGTGWFAATADEANFWGGMTSTGANVVPAYLSIKNPRVLHGHENASNARVNAALDSLTAGEDGVIVMEGGKVRWAVVVDPTQVKSSISNRGQFDGKAADMSAGTLAPAASSINPLRLSKARQEFASNLFGHAKAFIGRNPIDPVKLRVLTSLIGSKSDGLVIAGSQNPIMQMVASLVTETTTGAAGRKPTVAIRKALIEQKLIGNSVLDFESHFEAWRVANKLPWYDDLTKGEGRTKFNRAVYDEMLSRRNALHRVNPDAAVRQAADAMEGMFSRALAEQKRAGTLGSERLPADSKGYVPQALDGRKMAAATVDDINELSDHLAEHWANTLDWSPGFAKDFSRYYINRARARAMNTKGVELAADASDAVTAIRETLNLMEDQAKGDPANLAAVLRAKTVLSEKGLGQTRKRLDVALDATLPSGKRVLDFYDDNVTGLARRYANRTSGTVALTDANIHGSVGVRYLRDAITETASRHNAAVTAPELESFDRLMGEILGTPIEGEIISRNAGNLRLFVGLQRLGSLAFAQASETMNMLHHLGLSATLNGITSLPRMLGEVGRIKRGQAPGNHILTSIEAWGGEFGAMAYKMVMPLDPPDGRVGTYAEDPGFVARLLGKGSHIQQKVSFFRGIMAAQHRMAAEQITMRAARLIRDADVDPSGIINLKGGNLAALRDMGFTDDLIGALHSRIHEVGKWDATGRLIAFDITKVENPATAEAFVHSVHRGVSQIIQGTFVGEKTKWMHNDYLKLLGQLRSFGVTATEKQWQRGAMIHGGGARGYAYVSGLLLAQMTLALPIHMARVQLNAAGRDDSEAYIQRNLEPFALVRATMNYGSLSGMMGDVLDVTAGFAGGWSSDVGETLGGRQGQGAQSVAGAIPVLGSADAMAKALTGASSLGNSLKQLPMSNLPFVIPAINLMR